MKVEIIKGVACNPFHLSYLIGDVAEIEDKQAKQLIDAGVAKETEKAITYITETIETDVEIVDDETTETKPTKPKKGK